MKKYTIILIATIICIATNCKSTFGQSATSKSNIISNSSFEEGELGWTFWKEYPYGFRALNCWISPYGEPGKYDFSMIDKAIKPPEELIPPLPVSSSQHHPVGAIYDFQLFRAKSHTQYFAECIKALKAGDPNHAVMPQFYAGIIDRKEAALDLLGLATIPEWDIYATHDWPGSNSAAECLYAYSMNRYSKLPYWEDEFIRSQWERKGTLEPEMRASLERNLWRQITWGKRGIILFNLDSEWLHDSLDNRFIAMYFLLPGLNE